MTQLESTIQLNNLKQSAIKKGGYQKHAKAILEACSEHLNKFGVDHTPKGLKLV